MGWLLRRIVRFVLLIVVPLLVITAGVFAYAMGGRVVSTENAYVRTDVIAISSEVDGRVLRVHVDDNQYVQEGDLLFEIDPEPFVLELAAIDAEMAWCVKTWHRLGHNTGRSRRIQKSPWNE